MSATDELRRLLDDRGVRWRTDLSVANKVEWTIWPSPWFREVWAKEIDGRVSIFNAPMTPAQAIEATLGPAVPPPPAPDQPPYDVLLDILASEWGIDASWDGLRRFWCVELNDEGVRKRDELHFENAELRELVRAMATRLAYADRVVDGGVFDARLRREVAKLGVEVDG